MSSPPRLPDDPDDDYELAETGDAQSIPPLPTPQNPNPGEFVDEGKGRIFPCESCGADLKFQPGAQRLVCPYCGFQKELEFSETAVVAEQDFHDMLERLEEWRRAGIGDQQQTSEVRCESCGGQVSFTGTLTSSECPYCASPIQREQIHNSPVRIPVDGVLPFVVSYDVANEKLKQWVSSRWFAPTLFRKKGISGKFQGVYEPYFTFDSATFSQYSGERGDHYWVTVGSGKDKKRVRKTRWSSASGRFPYGFDDVMIHAARGLPLHLMRALEPWPLKNCQPFHPQFLAGLLARTYDLTLEEGFASARSIMEAALRQETKRLIGGDEQRISSLRTQYNAVTYKHLLLPVWLLSYQYHNKNYQVVINAQTGEVQGERPWSFWKIALAILAGLAVVGGIVLAQQVFARGGNTEHQFSRPAQEWQMLQELER